MRSPSQDRMPDWRKFPRRELLRIASLSGLGLTLPQLLGNEAARTAAKSQQRTGKARSCILVFLEGGPAHQDLWDMKPQAPLEVRGEFQPIASSLPGIPVCEHLPMVSQQWHHVAQIRSVHHTVVDHNAGSYYALTGRSPVNGGRLILGPEPDNFPHFGSVLAHLQPSDGLPEFVHIPEIMSNNGRDLPGQNAGFLGTRFDPFVSGDPSAPGYRVPGLSTPKDVSSERLSTRRTLMGALEREEAFVTDAANLRRHHSQYERAFTLLNSAVVQEAFNLEREPATTRERYGLPDRVDRSVEARKFGGLPHFGQSMLLARRLIEAGVRLVTVCTGRRFDQAWDTHRDHFPLLKKSLLPYFDRGFSALLEDLHQRGMLEETLVVAMGEFGRTPRLGQITSGAGADAAGRDHWPHCYTALLAGGGVQAGAIFGESDSFAAYPKTNPVTPEDIAATIYAALGIDNHLRLLDGLSRPHDLALGEVIRPVLNGL